MDIESRYALVARTFEYIFVFMQKIYLEILFYQVQIAIVFFSCSSLIKYLCTYMA